MFGTLRFVLALLVLGCHTDWLVSPSEVTGARELDLGGVAVIVFFILSGFVMTATVRRYYPSRDRYGAFLKDRAWRIFPQYLLWLTATLLWIRFQNPSAQPISLRPIAENILLLPLMFSVWDYQPWLTRVAYVGQTWSLSLELYFYLLLPILLWSPKLYRPIFLLSVAVFALATFNIINPNLYSYHLLPGVLFIFLMGGIAYDEVTATESAGTRLLWPYLTILGLALAGNALRTLHYHWTPEVLVGILAGLPLVAWLARRRPHPVDDWLGNLSYGIFLNHYFVIGILVKYKPVSSRWPVFWVTALGALLLAIPSYYFAERPFAKLRRVQRSKMQSAVSADR